MVLLCVLFFILFNMIDFDIFYPNNQNTFVSPKQDPNRPKHPQHQTQISLNLNKKTPRYLNWMLEKSMHLNYNV